MTPFCFAPGNMNIIYDNSRSVHSRPNNGGCEEKTQPCPVGFGCLRTGKPPGTREAARGRTSQPDKLEVPWTGLNKQKSQRSRSGFLSFLSTPVNTWIMIKELALEAPSIHQRPAFHPMTNIRNGGGGSQVEAPNRFNVSSVD